VGPAARFSGGGRAGGSGAGATGTPAGSDPRTGEPATMRDRFIPVPRSEAPCTRSVRMAEHFVVR